MTNHDRNVRTLIVSFVVALMVMVPLRFIEETQNTLNVTSQVLGETTAIDAQLQNINSANSAVKANDSLEAPYNKMEANMNCLAQDVADSKVEALVKQYGDNLTDAQSEKMFEEIDKIDKNTCK